MKRMLTERRTECPVIFPHHLIKQFLLSDSISAVGPACLGGFAGLKETTRNNTDMNTKSDKNQQRPFIYLI